MTLHPRATQGKPPLAGDILGRFGSWNAAGNHAEGVGKPGFIPQGCGGRRTGETWGSPRHDGWGEARDGAGESLGLDEFRGPPSRQAPSPPRYARHLSPALRGEEK